MIIAHVRTYPTHWLKSLCNVCTLVLFFWSSRSRVHARDARADRVLMLTDAATSRADDTFCPQRQRDESASHCPASAATTEPPSRNAGRARTRGHALSSTSPSTSPRCHEELDKGNHSEPLSNSLILSGDIIGESSLGTFGGRSLGVSFWVPGRGGTAWPFRRAVYVKRRAPRRGDGVVRKPTRTACARRSVVQTYRYAVYAGQTVQHVRAARECMRGECARARARERERERGRQREGRGEGEGRREEALFSRPAFWLLRVVEGRRTDGLGSQGG